MIRFREKPVSTRAAGCFEELLARPADGRLWVADVPDVESWNEKDIFFAIF